MHRSPRRRHPSSATLLLAVALILTLLGASGLSLTFFAPTEHTSDRQANDTSVLPPLPASTLPTADPIIDRHLPSLSAAVSVAPDPVVLGQPVTITVQVTNTAPDPATDLTILLPLPAGVTSMTPTLPLPAPFAAPSTTAGLPTEAWTWSPTLGGNASVAVTTMATVTQPPAGDALVLTPSVHAAGLSQPVQATGGALVLDPTQLAATHEFVPGTTAMLESADHHVTVAVPDNAARVPLTLAVDRTPPSGESPLPPLPTLHKGLSPFSLTATDPVGNGVHQFAQPVTITLQYTPEQLQATGMAEDSLTLFWFDRSATGRLPHGGSAGGQWVPVPTQVDRTAHVARATVDHFSDFQFGDGTQAASTYLPTLNGWQVGLFTGDATYDLSIAVPAGAGGIKPALTLHYDSAATDGQTGGRANQQASWVGKGWSLDPGYIARTDTGDPKYQLYTLVLGGHAYSLIPASGNTETTPNSGIDRVTGIEWHTADESFMKIRAYDTMPSAGDLDHGTYGRGAAAGGNFLMRHKWVVWAKDGTRYEFGEDLWAGWNGAQEYKWQLTKVTDTHNNAINYTYTHTMNLVRSNDQFYAIFADIDSVLTDVTWGGNTNGAPDRYKVHFDAHARHIDTLTDAVPAQVGGLGGAPQLTKALCAIQVLSNSPVTGLWDLVRQYNLTYGGAGSVDCGDNNGSIITSDNDTGATQKLTLYQVLRIGNNGSSILDTTTFTYGMNRGTGTWPMGSWNRLVGVANGRGGTVAFDYDNVADSITTNSQDREAQVLANYRRVIQKTVNGGFGDQPSVWHYAYFTPELNGVGSTLEGRPMSASGQTQADANSAGLVINDYFPGGPCCGQSSYWNYLLMTPELREFRGHSKVIVTNPDNSTVEHDFNQGNAGCTVSPHQDQLNLYVDGSDPCFLQLLANESFKGREAKTIAYDTSGNPLTETDYTYAADPTYFSAIPGTQPLSGLFRTNVTLAQKVEIISGGSSTRRTASYTYDAYDNLASTQESVIGGTGAYRTTKRYYAALDTVDANGNGRYIVDRPVEAALLDGSQHLLSLATTFYDGATSSDPLGAGHPTLAGVGDPTRVRTYLLPSTTLAEAGLPGAGAIGGVDTATTYDAYGNVQTTSSFFGTGTTQWSAGTLPQFTNTSSPGSPHTTTTTYDANFHAFPTDITGPQVASGYQPHQQGTWDFQMGTLMSATDVPNNATTSATYDLFGRILTLTKPLDGNATIQFIYHDTANPAAQQPMYYGTQQLTNFGTRSSVTFYDGLGRAIQTKSDGYDLHSIVADTTYEYDQTAHIQKVSQPRYVDIDRPSSNLSNPTSTFWSYAPRDTDANERWTTTTADALDRPVMLTTPDGNSATTAYTRTGVGWLATTTDAKAHRTTHETDLFGRLTQVIEYSGNNGSEGGYAPYATTTYQYDPRDLLTRVTDAQNNLTTIAYDSLGRKTDMSDPDMGAWQYRNYDGEGNLGSQQDANGNSTSFAYDALSRLTNENFSGPNAGSGTDGNAIYTYDEMTNGNLGGGHRTKMTNTAGTTTWVYDARGRVTNTTVTAQTAAGPVGPFALAMTYDSADQLITRTYPSTEIVTDTYDLGGRQTSACPGPGTSPNGLAALGRITPSATLSVTPNPAPDTRTPGPTIAATPSPIPTQRGGPPLPCYVVSATYSALGQPVQRTLGNTLVETWTYAKPTNDDHMARLYNHAVSTNLLNRTYTYDPVGNVTAIADSLLGQTQSFSYDHRDRLTHALTSGSATAAYDESDAYDATGNFLSKGTTTYSYTGSGHAHAPHTVGTATYAYDPNGNLTSDGGSRTFTWDARNLPTTIAYPAGTTDGGGTANLVAPARSMPTVAGNPNLVAPARAMPATPGTPNLTAPTRAAPLTEHYTYDADGERLTRTDASNTVTVSVGGVYEQDVQGTTLLASRVQVPFSGGMVAQRTNPLNGSSTATWLHGDHLGSVSLATNEQGSLLHQQEYGPWGNLRSGGVPETTLSYTGQKRDGTGLLYYHARYYDPALGRFLSPDSIGITYSNPQTLDRFAYAGNNPMNHTDPTGHCSYEEDSCTEGGLSGSGISHDDLTHESFSTGGHGGDSGSGDPASLCIKDDKSCNNPASQCLIYGPCNPYTDCLFNGGCQLNVAGTLVGYAQVQPSQPGAQPNYTLNATGQVSNDEQDDSNSTYVQPSLFGPPKGVLEACAENPDDCYVYRALADGEGYTTGLSPKNPGSTNSINTAISQGSRIPNQYIHTSRYADVALNTFGSKGQTVVKIDLRQVPSGTIVDVSTAQGRLQYGVRGVTATNFANAQGLVLIQGNIPASAITPIRP